MRRLHDWVLSLGAVVFFATGLVAIEAFLRVADPDYLNRLHGDEIRRMNEEALRSGATSRPGHLPRSWGTLTVALARFVLPQASVALYMIV
jgi:hypothetical protein